MQGNQIGLGLDAVRQAFPSDQAVSPGYASDCTLYVATRSSGVYKSTDCGASWTEVNTGLTELRLSQVEIPPDAANANTVFALSESGTLFRTIDGGAHWALVSTELAKIDRRNLVLSATFSTDDGTMYAAAQNWAWPEYANQPGVFKSTDGGVTWAHADSGMPDNHALYKVIASPDPAAPGVLYALTNSGIAVTTDGGTSWTAVSTPGSGGYLADLAISPDYATDATLFVAEQAGPGRIHRSDQWRFHLGECGRPARRPALPRRVPQLRRRPDGLPRRGVERFRLLFIRRRQQLGAVLHRPGGRHE